MFDEHGDGPLTGTVEMDETYVGGKPRYRGALKPHRNDDAPMFRTMAERVKTVRTGKFGGYAPVG